MKQVAKGGEATPFMISPTAALSRPPGEGGMACCAANHVVIGADGVPRPIPCRKYQMAHTMLRLLISLREYLLGSEGNLVNFRMWTALTTTVMKGLPTDGLPSPPQSVAEHLLEYRFNGPHDEVLGSGLTPLIFAALSGNVAVVKELITREHADVKARVQIDLPKYGIEKGTDVLSFAVANSQHQDQAREMVTLLLAAGADPNAMSSATGATPLIAAVSTRNLEGVRALIHVVPRHKLDLEKGLRTNNATALLVAGYLSTFEIVKALLDAGANKEHM